MGNWEIEHSAESKAPPESIWERYTDVDLWPEWSEGLDESNLEGEFEAGSKGSVKPSQLMRSRFELIEVEPERRFVSKAGMPGAKITLDHLLESTEGGTRITHKATMSGPLSGLWTRVVGKIVERDLPSSVDRLAELAVEKEEEAREEAKRDKEREEKRAEADKKFKEEIEKTSSGDGDAGGASLPGSV